MSDEAEPVRVWCKGCIAVFVAFLQKIAGHNAKLVCPNCGTINTVPERIPQAPIQGSFTMGLGRADQIHRKTSRRCVLSIVNRLDLAGRDTQDD